MINETWWSRKSNTIGSLLYASSAKSMGILRNFVGRRISHKPTLRKIRLLFSHLQRMWRLNKIELLMQSQGGQKKLVNRMVKGKLKSISKILSHNKDRSKDVG